MNPLMAARAYAATQGTGGASAGAAVAGGGDFGSMLAGVMNDVQSQTKAAEAQMSQTVKGQGSMIDVVTAVSSAEASLETVIAVRDQVISAYQEIMRMPI